MAELVAAAVVAVLFSARVTRLIIHDKFPPSVWLRKIWDRAAGESPWGWLLRCNYCLPPWIMLVTMLLAWWMGVFTIDSTQDVWWFVASWLGLSYVSSMLVTYDGDD